MAKTLLNLSTSLAYRLGENGVPNSANETNRRTSFLNEGYRDVMRRHYWWFTEATTTFNSVAGQESYGTSDGVPTNMRQILELRFQNKLYRQITQYEAVGAQTTPYTNAAESYFLFNGKIYPIPAFSSSVSNGISIKYFKTHTELSSNSDTILIPDIFSDALVSYAYAKIMQGEGERGSMEDGMNEYNEIIKSMTEEQNKYLFSMKGSSSTSELIGTYE